MSEQIFTVNQDRTYWYPVQATVYDQDGKEQTGEFDACFKVLHEDRRKELAAEGSKASVFDEVVVEFRRIKLIGKDGQPLEGAALKAAVEGDPALSEAVISAYKESNVKKNRRLI